MPPSSLADSGSTGVVDESSAPAPLCRGPDRVTTGLRLHGCTRPLAVRVSFGLNPGGTGASPDAARRASARPSLCRSNGVQRRHGRHGSQPGRSSASERSPLTVSEQRSSTPSPTPPDPAAVVAGSSPTARTVGRAGRAKPPSSSLAAGVAGPVPPARAPWVMWRVGSNGGPLPHYWAGGQCAAVSLVSGVSWAARWCAGSPEPTNCRPVGLSAGRGRRVELPGQCYRGRIAAVPTRMRAVSACRTLRWLTSGARSQLDGRSPP